MPGPTKGCDQCNFEVGLPVRLDSGEMLLCGGCILTLRAGGEEVVYIERLSHRKRHDGQRVGVQRPLVMAR